MSSTTMTQSVHKNKAFTTLLAFLVGTLGLHRFYLHGGKDRWGWRHLAALPASAALHWLFPDADWFYQILPLILSGLAGFLEALVLGLMPDEKWDGQYNSNSSQQSDTGWPLAVV